MERLLRRTWAEIDLDALAHNFRQVKNALGEKVKICCVIKADAYGHGAVRMADELEGLGADFFGVSNLEEALQLRLAGMTPPVLIFGYTPPEEAKRLSAYDISQCVYSPEYAKALSDEAVAAGVSVKIHIKVDSGMSRIGFYYQDISRDAGAVAEVEKACHLPRLLTQGIFTHFACADEGESGDLFTMRQFGCFKEMSEELVRRGISFELRHCANSAAIFDYPLSHLDMVRAGIVLYGLAPSGSLRHKPELKPVLSFKSVVSHVKEVKKGATVSYGREYKAQEERIVATVAVGYADGYPRVLSNEAEVLINGARCKIIGRICMDQLMVDVSEAGDVKPGDEVVLIGKSGSEEITADELASLEGSINYEVVCDIGKRVPRVYIKNGRIDSVSNQLVQLEEV